jgi:hypothetical protein
MQEHIRRAHPEHYISKLPATEESFQLMINTPPSERPPPPPPTTSSNLAPHGPYNVCRPRPILTNDIGYGNERQSYYREDSSTPNTPRNLEDFQLGSMLPAASAAAALAQLHNHKLENDWESEGVRHSHSRSSMQSPSLTIWQDWMSDTEARKQAMRSSIELPPLHHAHANNIEPTSDPFSHLNPHRRRELLPSILNTSPPGRSSTLPPIQRHPSTNRPRKPSVSKRAREPQHKRQKSRGENAHLRRMSYDRKAYSAEPSSALSAAYGKRWEDLIDAATSATEDVNEDRTPVSGSQSNYLCSELTNSRFLHHLYPSIVPLFRHFPPPTFKVTRRLPFNKPLPHHPTSQMLLNHFHLSNQLRVVMYSTSNLVDFRTRRLHSRRRVYRYTVQHVRE